jgi:hypothetical protein
VGRRDAMPSGGCEAGERLVRHVRVGCWVHKRCCCGAVLCGTVSLAFISVTEDSTFCATCHDSQPQPPPRPPNPRSVAARWFREGTWACQHQERSRTAWYRAGGGGAHLVDNEHTPTRRFVAALRRDPVNHVEQDSPGTTRSVIRKPRLTPTEAGGRRGGTFRRSS